VRRGQADGDKGRRTLLHQAVKQSLPGLVSDTVRNDAGDICVRIYRKGQVNGGLESSLRVFQTFFKKNG
jgi:hypothetical protein